MEHISGGVNAHEDEFLAPRGAHTRRRCRCDSRLQIREMNLFSLPFIMPDQRAFDALTSGAVRGDLDKTLASRDAVALAWSASTPSPRARSRAAVC